MTNDNLGKDAVNARIAQHCEWFGVEPCKIRSQNASVILTDELFDWCHRNGTSFDWIFLGDARSLAAVFKSRCDADREAGELFRNFDAEEQAEMIAAMQKSKSSDQQSFEGIMQDFAAFVRARHAAQKAA